MLGLATRNLNTQKIITFCLVALTTLGVGCSSDKSSVFSSAGSLSSASPLNQEAPVIGPVPVEALSPTLGTELPASRYLSAQKTENPRPVGATRGGYDHSYKMLTFRRLEPKHSNPSLGKKHHVEGLRPGAKTIRRPLELDDEIDSQKLVQIFLTFLGEDKARFKETLARIKAERARAIARHGARPRVIVSGLGPVGLLTTLEAYAAGSSVVGVEERSQYTRPQILRLTTDTINRITHFTGVGYWTGLMRARGVVSKSPNWTPNKFDTLSEFLYPGQSEATAMASLTPQERAEREQYIQRGYEIEAIDIVRINHLETILAAVLELIAQDDPEHVRIYYGSSLTATLEQNNVQLKLEIAPEKTQSAVLGDIIAVCEGARRKMAEDLKLSTTVLSESLFGATVALRLPKGFDIGLRPIENRKGTASVRGIAVMDPQKLTLPANPIVGDVTGRLYNWTMIGEQALCKQLNDVLNETAVATNTQNPDDGVLMPCDVTRENLAEPWSQRNGGDRFFLPRSRYFFTGGIAYMGAELSARQLEMFQKRNDADQAISGAAKAGFKKFMVILAKKHMPREYIEGATQQPVAAQALGSDTLAADILRVAMVTEEAYSLSLFPIELKKAAQFSVMSKPSRPDDKARPLRIALLGDTDATTHFFTGSGAVNGLRSAIYFGEALAAGSSLQAWEQAAAKLSKATDEMHEKVMEGKGNAPLDGPFNKRLKI